jgi:hypothetical protein
MADDARLIGTVGNVLKLVRACELSETNRNVGVGTCITFQLGHDFFQGVVLFAGGKTYKLSHHPFLITYYNLHRV